MLSGAGEIQWITLILLEINSQKAHRVKLSASFGFWNLEPSLPTIVLSSLFLDLFLASFPLHAWVGEAPSKAERALAATQIWTWPQLWDLVFSAEKKIHFLAWERRRMHIKPLMCLYIQYMSTVRIADNADTPLLNATQLSSPRLSAHICSFSKHLTLIQLIFNANFLNP